MKKIIISVVLLFIPISSINPWGGKSHSGMTKAAAKSVFNLDTLTTYTVKVHVEYNMSVDFAKTVGMGIGGNFSPVAALIGTIVDKAVIDKKFDVKWDSTFVGTQDKLFELAGSAPDNFDAPTGLIGEGDCLIGHIYAPNGIGFADYMVEYFYKKAVDAWKKNKNLAFIYLGFASHYFVDAGIPVHAEADYRNLNVLQWQYKYHSYTEGWISDNWDFRYKSTVDSAAQVALPVCDIGAGVRSLAFETYPDIAEWNSAWGAKGGTSFEEMMGSESGSTVKEDPQNLTRFDELVKMEIWRCVPRVVGLFIKFKKEVGI